MSLVRILSEFAHDLRYEDLPLEVADQTKLHILDALGVLLMLATKAVSRKRAEDIALLVDRLEEVDHLEELTSLFRNSEQE
jgi:2-methylcitrate dehydratase PrpD